MILSPHVNDGGLPHLASSYAGSPSQELEGQGRAHHTGLESLHLMAWKLSGVSYEQQDFQKKLSAYHSGQLELHPGRL
jgi:hypothetical protein